MFVVTFTTAGKTRATTASTGSLEDGMGTGVWFPPSDVPLDEARLPTVTAHPVAIVASTATGIRSRRNGGTSMGSSSGDDSPPGGDGFSRRDTGSLRASRSSAHHGSLPQGDGRPFLPGVDERDRRGASDQAVAVLRLDVERVPGAGELDRHPDVADVLLQAGRPDGIRHVSDLRVARPDEPVFGHLRTQLVAFDLDAHQLAVDPRASQLLQGALPDVVLRLLFDEALEPHHVERRVAQPEVGPVV